MAIHSGVKERRHICNVYVLLKKGSSCMEAEQTSYNTRKQRPISRTLKWWANRNRFKSFFRPKSDETKVHTNKVTIVELLMTQFIVEHNLPISAVDHMTELLKAMFTDSKVAQDLACKQTKTTHLIHEMADSKFWCHTTISPWARSWHQCYLCLPVRGPAQVKISSHYSTRR